MTEAKVLAFRARRAAGKVVLAVEVVETDVEEMLIRAGLLVAGEEHSRAALNAALATMVTKLCELDA